nr:multicopper oxidase domain-containing protein [uncultured Rhodopila sp.]
MSRHLHRHSFELTHIGGKATSGVVRDVAMLGGFHKVAFDCVAANPGLSLFHCHQQLHMDFGFMALFDYGQSFQRAVWYLLQPLL